MKSRRRLPRVVSLLWLGAVCAMAAGRPPNFLVVISDDQRPDTIAALGNPHIRTPHLDRLARDGAAFTRATCANPHCVPSRAEILTGCTGFRNGVQAATGKLRGDVTFWGDALRRAGYHTWYAGKWMNDGSPKTRGYEETRGLFSSGGSGGKGFTVATDHKGARVTGYSGWTFKTDDGRVELDKGIGLTADTSRHIADAAIELIQRKPARPFFLHVNFTAPHDPLIVPPPYEGRYAPDTMPLPRNFLPEHPFDHGNLKGRDELLLPWPRTPGAIRRELAAYYAVIEDMDAQLGRILAALDAAGQREHTVIIFSSDHGLALGSHGLMGKQNQYEHTIGVPLLMAGPGIPAGRRVDAQCYLRDLFPTTCELAGVPVPDTVEGRSLMPVLRGEVKEVYPHVVGCWQDVQRMIREGNWKVICYPKAQRWQMFNVANDPDELNDVLRDFASLGEYEQTLPKFTELRGKLIDWLTANNDPLAEQLAGVRPAFEPEPGKPAVMVFGTGRPVAVPFTRGLTVTQAVRATGAAVEKGRATVWRLDGAREPADLAQIATGKLPDPKLEAGETVFVAKPK
jgi:arylsulfatase A-like enzyme